VRQTRTLRYGDQMKRPARKLTIHSETVRMLRTLDQRDLASALGGDEAAALGGTSGRECPVAAAVVATAG